MATGVVSGLAALVLDAHPDWTPGEVKYVLMETAESVRGKGEAAKADAAVAFSEVPESTDDGLTPSYILIAAALELDELVFDGIRWRDSFEVYFDGIRWRDVDFEGIRWWDVDWSGIRWRGIRWRSVVEN